MITISIWEVISIGLSCLSIGLCSCNLIWIIALSIARKKGII